VFNNELCSCYSVNRTSRQSTT